MGRLTGRLAGHPILTLAAVTALVALSLVRVGTLAFDSDINRVFLSDSPLSQAQRDFEARFAGAGAEAAILIEGDPRLTIPQIEAARGLALDLELDPGVVAVASPFALRFPPGHPTRPDAPVIPPDLDQGELSRRLAEFEALETGLPVTFTDRALLIVATLEPEAGGRGAIPDILEARAAPIRAAGASVAITGPGVVEDTIRTALARDLMRLDLAGTGLAAILAWLSLGTVRLAALAILPALPGMVATIGIAAWLGLPITVLNNVIPMLVLVIGVANGMHLSVHLARTEGVLSRRITDTLSAVGPASVLTAATTGIAFLAVLVTPNAQVRDFGILGAVGAVVGMALLLPTFAALAALLAPGPRPVGTRAGRVALACGMAAAARPRAWVAAGLLALAGAGAGFWATTPWFPYSSHLPETSALAAANDRIADGFGGVYRAWVEMPPGADWGALRDAVTAVEAVATEHSVLSEVALARWHGDPGIAPPPDTLARLPATVTERLRDPDDGTLRFAVAMPEPMRSEATLARYDAIEAAALGAGAARVIGLPAVMRHGSVELVRQLSFGLLLASAGGALVVAAARYNLRLLPTLLIVNLLPVLLVGSLPHLLQGGHLTPPVTLALTVAFGIAIDDTIHIVIRFHRALGPGGDRRNALSEALSGAGGVIVLTTLLLTGAMAVTLFSVFAPVAHFGLALIASLWAALLTDIVLLPALLMIGDRHARP
nr:MMPL family transporter [Palleronia pontilimi]